MRVSTGWSSAGAPAPPLRFLSWRRLPVPPLRPPSELCASAWAALPCIPPLLVTRAPAFAGATWSRPVAPAAPGVARSRSPSWRRGVGSALNRAAGFRTRADFWPPAAPHLVCYVDRILQAFTGWALAALPDPWRDSRGGSRAARSAAAMGSMGLAPRGARQRSCPACTRSRRTGPRRALLSPPAACPRCLGGAPLSAVGATVLLLRPAAHALAGHWRATCHDCAGLPCLGLG